MVEVGFVRKKKKKKETGVTGGEEFVLPRGEIEELERRNKIVREDPLSESFVSRGVGERAARQKGREELKLGQQEESQTQATAADLIAGAGARKEEGKEGEGKGILETAGDAFSALNEKLGITKNVLGTEENPVAAGTLPIGAGGLLGQSPAALSKGKQIVKSKKSLKAAKKFSVTLFDKTVGLKEIIIGASVYSQKIVRDRIKNMNADATKMGTERNEKIARDMISGLDPDTAIEIYEADRDSLLRADESLKLLEIFFIADYITGDTKSTHLNIRNQIDGKDSRISEALKFKAGLTSADIQQGLELEDLGKGERGSE